MRVLGWGSGSKEDEKNLVAAASGSQPNIAAQTQIKPIAAAAATAAATVTKVNVVLCNNTTGVLTKYSELIAPASECCDDVTD